MDPRTAHIPVLVVSADASPGQIRRLAVAGAAGYLTKPIDISTFLNEIDVYAVFPARLVLMVMLERNPAPGTEGDPLMTTRYDFATGEMEVLGPQSRDRLGDAQLSIA